MSYSVKYIVGWYSQCAHFRPVTKSRTTEREMMSIEKVLYTCSIFLWPISLLCCLFFQWPLDQPLPTSPSDRYKQRHSRLPPSSELPTIQWPSISPYLHPQSPTSSFTAGYHYPVISAPSTDLHHTFRYIIWCCFIYLFQSTCCKFHYKVNKIQI